MCKPHTSPYPTCLATVQHKPMTLLNQARWLLGVLTELAQPGHMALAAVLADGGEVIDFIWRQASPTATLALGCAGEELEGCRFKQVLSRCAIDGSVFEGYRAVFLQQRAQTLRVESKDGVTVHCISPLPAGLTVEVSRVAAVNRMLAAQQAMRERE